MFCQHVKKRIPKEMDNLHPESESQKDLDKIQSQKKKSVKFLLTTRLSWSVQKKSEKNKKAHGMEKKWKNMVY